VIRGNLVLWDVSQDHFRFPLKDRPQPV
jgi:hypothetical protein